MILAHYYVPPEVQAAADYVGDSFALAKLAVDLPQQTIVLCGVEFMGESAKLLNPDKTVLLPEPAADCPMAHMISKPDIDRVRAIRKSRLVEVAEGQPAQGDFPACLVANENYHHFRVVLARTDPATERLILTAAQLDALKCHAGDRVRLVRLCAEEKTA